MKPWELGNRRSLLKVDRGFLCWAWFCLNVHHKSLKKFYTMSLVAYTMPTGCFLQFGLRTLCQGLSASIQMIKLYLCGLRPPQCQVQLFIHIPGISLHYGGSFCSPAIIRIPASCVPILLSDTHWRLVWLCLEVKSWARVYSLEARARPCSVEAQQLVSHDVDAKLRPSVLICPPGHPIFELLYDIRGLLPLRIKTCDTGFLSLKIESPPHKCCLYIHHNQNEYGYEDNGVFVLSRPRLCMCYAFFKYDRFWVRIGYNRDWSKQFKWYVSQEGITEVFSSGISHMRSWF